MTYIILTLVLNGWVDKDRLVFKSKAECIAVLKQLYPIPIDSIKNNTLRPNKICVSSKGVSGFASINKPTKTKS